MALIELYGLLFETDLPLAGHNPVTQAAPRERVRVVVERSKQLAPLPALEPDSLLARSEAGVLVWERAGTYVLRVRDLCEAVVPASLDSLTVRPAVGATQALVTALVAGTFAALLLTLRGHWPLHASAVSLHGSAIAIAGASGMGKSTWATALCWGGAKLVTDDVLATDLDGPSVSCRPGSTALRLRHVPKPLSTLVSEAEVGRHLWLPTAVSTPTPLGAILVPNRAKGLRPALRQLERVEALQCLARFPRILGWQASAFKAQQFHHLCGLVRRVPIYEASMPETPSFEELCEELPVLVGRAAA